MILKNIFKLSNTPNIKNFKSLKILKTLHKITWTLTLKLVVV